MAGPARPTGGVGRPGPSHGRRAVGSGGSGSPRVLGVLPVQCCRVGALGEGLGRVWFPWPTSDRVRLGLYLPGLVLSLVAGLGLLGLVGISRCRVSGLLPGFPGSSLVCPGEGRSRFQKKKRLQGNSRSLLLILATHLGAT